MDERRHFVVTAGTTYEAIDDVRQWSNVFTGKTGLDIALALLDLGDVTLLTSNQAHAEAYDGFYGKKGMLGIETFRTHAELREILEERVAAGGGGKVAGVLMTAAVSDYRPAGVYRVVKREMRNAECGMRKEGEENRGLGSGQEIWVVEDVQAAKVKSTHGTIAVVGEATEKLVDLFRGAWGFRGLLVKFKLEVGLAEAELVAVAEASRKASGADYMVANTLEMVRGERPGAYILGEGFARAWGGRSWRGGCGIWRGSFWGAPTAIGKA